MPKKELDRVDYEILHHLQNDARITNAELADRVCLSPSPCLRRVKNLEEANIIQRYTAIVDPKAVGLPISVVVNVSMSNQERSHLNFFEQRLAECEEVMEAYLMTGNTDYMLRIVVPDLEAYERFLFDKLTPIPGVTDIKSSFALKQLFGRTELPFKGR